VREKKDGLERIIALENDDDINQNIGILGRSLTGAIGLQALGSDKRIRFGIIESTFSFWIGYLI